MGKNLLAGETSPYLAQHRDNPVAWRPWGAAAFAEALALDRPILLSVGYAACHWCHVMAHESFEDEETAALINQHFIAIKVDREERPDVDALYQKALALFGEQGGWPLTLFLMPDRRPFWGGTYFPKTARYGRPAFQQVLKALAVVWQHQRSDAETSARSLMKALHQEAAGQTPAQGAGGQPVVLGEALLERAADHLLDSMDPVQGGLSGAPKFPMPFVLTFLWRMGLRTGKAELGHAVILTLQRMAQGGIYDHLGGGFARYSVDEVWLVPHFEKMLYDNAQLIDLLTEVWTTTRESLLAQRVEETIAWVEREMVGENGAWAATQDADSEGGEGRFYLWTKAEVDALLGEEAPAFCRSYNVTVPGNWEGHTILNRSAAPRLGSPEEEARLAACRQVLFTARKRRVAPGRDDKVLTDWNGLMIAAMARAAVVFNRPAWLAAAERAFAGIVSHLSLSPNRLAHSLCRGQVTAISTLEDQAAMIRAALRLYQITGADPYRAQARAWLDGVEEDFSDDAGAWFETPRQATDLIVRHRSVGDSATPSGFGLIVESLATLFALTGEDGFYQRAEAAIAGQTLAMVQAFPSSATALNGACLLHHGQVVVVTAAADDPQGWALSRAALTSGRPDVLLRRVDPATPLATGDPARGKGLVGGKAAAWLCRGPVCAAPVTETQALLDLINTG